MPTASILDQSRGTRWAIEIYQISAQITDIQALVDADTIFQIERVEQALLSSSHCPIMLFAPPALTAQDNSAEGQAHSFNRIGREQPLRIAHFRSNAGAYFNNLSLSSE